jgi:hypothetical protein
MKKLLAVLLFLPFLARAETEMPIFDAHLHYSHDAWEVVPPQAFVDILRKANIRRALVSSSNNEGTRMLQERAPEIIVPELRPYRSRGELGTWARDPTVVPFIEDLLAKRKYVAIGEFHIYGADADLPNMRRIVELAKQNRLFLHSHSDSDAVARHFAQDPTARVLWAHSGFDRIPIRTRWRATSRRIRPRACCGRIRASSGPRTCASCCASIRTCGAISPSSRHTPRTAR